MNMTLEQKRNFLVLEVARLRKLFNEPCLCGDDYLIANLEREYARLIELEDYYYVEV